MKIWIFGQLATQVRQNKSLGWNITIEEQTAEVGTRAYTGFNGVTIEHRLPNRIEIKGSLHEYWNDLNGQGRTNGNRFYHSDICRAIDSICSRLNLHEDQLPLCSFEFGLNLFDPPFDISATIDCFCAIYTRRFVDWPSEHGRLAKCGQNILKAYHKGKVLGSDLQIFRFENHVDKMQWLESRGIKINTLGDFKNLDKLVALHKELMKSIRKITIHEPNAPTKGLTRTEKVFWKESGNPLVWKGYTDEEISDANKAHRKIKERICKNSTNEILANLFNDEFALLSGVKLIDSKKSYRVEENAKRKNLTERQRLNEEKTYHLDERYDSPPCPHDASLPAFAPLDQIAAHQDSCTCLHCGNPIKGRSSSARYCTPTCKRQWEAKHKRRLRRSLKYGNTVGHLFDGP